MYMDMISIFCLWMYDNQALEEHFQCSGYDAITAIRTHAGIDNLRSQRGFQQLIHAGRRLLRNVDVERCVADVLEDGSLGMPYTPPELMANFAPNYKPVTKMLPEGRETRYLQNATDLASHYGLQWTVHLWTHFYIMTEEGQ